MFGALKKRHERLNSERQQKIQHYENVFFELEKMPQFFDFYGGIVNVLNGCKISYSGQGLELSWNNEGANNGLSFILNEQESNKYLALMKIQSKQLNQISENSANG